MKTRKNNNNKRQKEIVITHKKKYKQIAVSILKYLLTISGKEKVKDTIIIILL